jgi:hypothetical protein
VAVEGTGNPCGEVNPEDDLTYNIVVHTFLDGHIRTRTYALNPETGVCGFADVCSGAITETYYTKTIRCWQSFAAPIYKYTEETTYVFTITYAANCVPGAGVWSGSGVRGWVCSENCDEAAPPWGVTSVMNADGTITETPYGDGPYIVLGDMGACDPAAPADVDTYTLAPTPLLEEADTYSSPAGTTVVFPDYPEWGAVDLESGQSLDCNGFRNWSPASEDPPVPEGVTREEKKFKWRPQHLPTGTCYLKVWFKKTSTPTVGAPAITYPAPYEWSSSASPCLTVPTDPADADSQLIEGTADEEGVPTSNGTVTIEVIKYSCVEGYEPDVSDDENPQPNGYPDPDWEAAPP